MGKRTLGYWLSIIAGLQASLVGMEITAAETDRSTMEEIVVTAQRRDEKLLDVPISMSVLEASSAQGFGISEVNDLYRAVPGLTLNGASGSAGEGFKVRGIGGSIFADGIEQSVSVVIDEVVTGSSGSGLLDFWDIQQIEVLRGPQGTLFGKNASAGLISIATANPTDQFEAFVQGEYGGEYGDTRVEGAVSGPVTDKLAMRLSGFYEDRDKGYIKNIVRNEDENKKERWGARLKSSWAYSERFQIDASLEYSEQDNVCCSRTFYSLNPDVVGSSAFSALFLSRVNANGIVPDNGLLLSINDAPITHVNEVTHATLKPTWTFDNGFELRSITGYRNWYQKAITDSDMIDIDIANRLEADREMDIYTQEFQILSPSGEKLEYLFGLYYFYQKFAVDADLRGGAFLTGGTQLQTLQETEVESRNYAAYFHLTYDFSDRWEGFLGGRILRDEIEADFVSDGTFFVFPTGPLQGTAEEGETDWIGSLGLKLYLNENQMFYTSVSKGYKGPAIDVSASAVIADPTKDSTLDSEKVYNYEIGSKSTFLDGVVGVNTTLFYSEVDDFQASSFDSPTSTFLLKNAGEVSTKGLELEVYADLSENLAVNLGVAYVDAVFEKFDGVACTSPQLQAGTCFNSAATAPPGAMIGQDLSGESVNQTPKWSFLAGVRYDFQLGNMPGYARIDASWKDKSISDLDLDPNTTVDSYALVNFELGITLAPRVEITGWVRNATDTEYTNRIFDAPVFDGAYAHFPMEGRTAGIRAKYTFD